MANPLFYRKVVPLNRDTHRKLRLKTPTKPFDYARTAHLIPATIDEFTAAAPEIPIAFLPGAAQPAAVFVTGLKPGNNVFIAEDGRWDGSYVPAYLRRYPFIIGEVPGAEAILCIDEEYEGFAPGEYEGFVTADGAKLFTKNGKPEPVVDNALALANSYRAAAKRTDAFATLLQGWGLFRSVTLDAKLPDGQSTVVHGLLTVDEDALAGLADDRFLELRRNGYLKPLYAHLLSLGTVSKLAARTGRPPAAGQPGNSATPKVVA